MHKLKIVLYLMSVSLVLAACGSTQSVAETEAPKTATRTVKANVQFEPIEDLSALYVPDSSSSLVALHTKYGTLKIELFCTTPQHRANFLDRISSSYYDSLLFHRVVRGFVIQGGAPDSKGAAAGARIGNDVPYTVPAEINKTHFHVRGALAAARQPDASNPEKASSGAQFYIVHGQSTTEGNLNRLERTYGFVYPEDQRKQYLTKGGSPQLDMEYTVFGRVYEGLDIIDSIATKATDDFERPLKDVKMSFSILKK